MPIPSLVSGLASQVASAAISKVTSKLTSLVGGFPDTSKLPAVAGIGSLTAALATGSLKDTASGAVTSAVQTAVPGLSTLADQFNSSVDDVSINSKYYPASQPYLARMILNFPATIEDEVTTTTTTKGATASPTDYVSQATSPVLNTLNAGQQFITTTTTSQVTNTVPTFNDTVNEGDYLEVRPNNFLGLDYQRITNGVGTFTITLFDPKWDLIEKKLCANKGYFRFKYGYTDDAPATMSPWYTARALSYKMDYGMEGCTITITGLTLGYVLNFTKSFDAKNINNEKISDIAIMICEATGDDYIPIVEPTKTVGSRDSIDSTDLINKPITFTAQTRLRGIIDELLKYAINDAGEGNYVFFIRVTETGDKEFHFHTVHYDQPNTAPTPAVSSSPVSTFTSNLTPQGASEVIGNLSSSVTSSASAPVSKIPGFTQFRNKNSALVRFTPSWAMTIAQLTGGGGTVAPNIDVTTKNLVAVNLNMDNTPQKLDGKGNIVKVVPTNFVEKKTQDEMTFAGFNLLVLPDRSAQQNEAAAKATFSKSYPGAITATLEIIGTPNFYLTQKIAVFIFRPQGDNGQANVSNIHWLSGFFRILKINDTVRAGKFMTTFQLVSDARPLIAPDPVKSVS